jgi:hypothetical protein
MKYETKLSDTCSFPVQADNLAEGVCKSLELLCAQSNTYCTGTSSDDVCKSGPDEKCATSEKEFSGPRC